MMLHKEYDVLLEVHKISCVYDSNELFGSMCIFPVGKLLGDVLHGQIDCTTYY